jgi:hypothetical protein
MAHLFRSAARLALLAASTLFAACGSSSGSASDAQSAAGAAAGGGKDSGGAGGSGHSGGSGHAGGGSAGSSGASSGGAGAAGSGSGGSANGCHTASDCPRDNLNPATAGVTQCLAPGQAVPPTACGAAGWCGQCNCGPQPQTPIGNGMSCQTSTDCPAATPSSSSASVCDMGLCAQCATKADCPAAAPACATVRGGFFQSFRLCVECALDTDCPSSKPHCAVSGGIAKCVACASDTDCAMGVCSNGACVPGCSAQIPCQNPLTQCGATQRCEALTCQNDAACPPNTACQEGHCTRRACSQDSDCDGGNCVNRICYETLGTCYTQMLYP